MTTRVAGLPVVGWRAIAGLAALALAVKLGTLALAPPTPTAATETLTPGPFTVAIAGVGDLVPAQRHTVAAPFSAKVDALSEEGKEVAAGAVVAKLNTQDIEENLQEEELRQSTLVKDEEVRALTAKRDRKSLQTDRQAAQADLGLRLLALKQLVAGYPPAQLAALGFRASATARAFVTAEGSYHLQEGLLAKGVIRAIDLETAKVAFEEAKKERDVAATALAIAHNGYPPQQVAVARLQVQRARNVLTEIDGKIASLAKTARMERDVAAAERAWSHTRLLMFQHRLAAATLKAPTAGVVVLNAMWANGQRKKLQVGDEAREGQSFMEVADVRQIFIKTEIKEVDIGRVHVGMPAKIHVATLSKTFGGKLTHLGVLAYEKPDAVNREGAPRVFEGLIATDERSPAFRPGMTVDVQLVVQQLPNALTVPNSALSTHDGQPVVWVQAPGRAAERRVVVTGEHTDDRTVIASGVAAGERVLVTGER